MNSIEQRVLAAIQRAAGKRSEGVGRYRVRVGDVEVLTRANTAAEAESKAMAWHRRHTAALSRGGLVHTNPKAATMSVR